MAEPHESKVYSDLAIIYDSIFGRMFVDSEHSVIDSLKLRPNQRVLEVGVGTGISLDAYPPYVHVVGIDPSADMLQGRAEESPREQAGATSSSSRAMRSISTFPTRASTT